MLQLNSSIGIAWSLHFICISPIKHIAIAAKMPGFQRRIPIAKLLTFSQVANSCQGLILKRRMLIPASKMLLGQQFATKLSLLHRILADGISTRFVNGKLDFYIISFCFMESRNMLSKTIVIIYNAYTNEVNNYLTSTKKQ